MAKAYSKDLRERILSDVDAGMSTEDAARKYRVSISWAYSLRKQRRETGSIEPKEYKPGQKLKLAPYEVEFRQIVANHPDATLEELCVYLSEYVSVSTATVHDFLNRLKITWKKRRSAPSSNIGKRSPKNVSNGRNFKS